MKVDTNIDLATNKCSIHFDDLTPAEFDAIRILLKTQRDYGNVLKDEAFLNLDLSNLIKKFKQS